MIRKTILRNTSLGMVSQGISTVLAVFITPFMIYHLGLGTYGLWILVSSVLGYLGLTDLGLRPAIGRFVALHHAKEEHNEINAVAVTSLGTLVVIMLAIWLTTLLAPLVFFRLFHVDAAQNQTATFLLWFVGLSLGLGMPLSVFDGLLIGCGRYDVTYAVDIGGAVARAGSTVVLLITGYGVVALTVANFVIQVATGFAQIVCAHRIIPTLRLSPVFWQFRKLKELYRLGVWSFVTMLWHRLAFATDNVIIGWALNTEAVAVYSIAGRLISYALTGADSFSTVLMPHAAGFHAQADVPNQRRLFKEGTKGSLLYAAFVAAVFLLYGRQLIELWVGSRFGSSALVLQILILPMVCFIGAKTANIVLFTMGERTYRWVALILWVDALCNVVLSVILVKRWGMLGVAYGTFFTMTVTMILVLPLYACRSLATPFVEYLKKTYLVVFGTAIPLFASLWIIKRVWLPTQLLPLASLLATSALVYFAVVYHLYFSRRSEPSRTSSA